MVVGVRRVVVMRGVSPPIVRRVVVVRGVSPPIACIIVVVSCVGVPGIGPVGVYWWWSSRAVG
jgi:hypothetical protein